MQRAFSKVNIEITNLCNLQCTFCPEVIRDKNFIGVALFERIIQQVAPLTELVTFHLMGEPLLHPEIKTLLDICTKYKTKVFFVSNGVLLKQKGSDILLHPSLHQVSFSLHTYPNNYPGKAIGPYLEEIFSFTEKAFVERPDLFINYRLWNLNDPNGSQTDNQEMLTRIEEKFQVAISRNWDVRERKRFNVKGRLALHFDTEFTWPSLDLPLLGNIGRCHGLSNHFGILVDGTVVPCCLDKEGNIPLGNIKELPVSDILGSERAQKILKGFQKNQLVEELCKRCQYITRFNG